MWWNYCTASSKIGIVYRVGVGYGVVELLYCKQQNWYSVPCRSGIRGGTTVLQAAKLV